MMSSSGVPSPFVSLNSPRIMGAPVLLVRSVQNTATDGCMGPEVRSVFMRELLPLPKVMRPLLLTNNWLLPV